MKFTTVLFIAIRQVSFYPQFFYLLHEAGRLPAHIPSSSAVASALIVDLKTGVLGMCRNGVTVAVAGTDENWQCPRMKSAVGQAPDQALFGCVPTASS
jgi:hypothetical protein